MDERKTGAELAVRAEPTGLAVGVRLNGMADVWRLAEDLSKARGFVPDAYIDKPAALAAVILTGMELGLGPMQSMREIHIIKGKPSISAVLMLGLAHRAGIKTRWVTSDATIATIGVTLPGQPEQTMSFTAEEAKRAGLSGENWQKYMPAMLRARAASAAIRAFCPEVIGGSVYESESGEITGGVPASQFVDAEVIPATPATSATRSKLEDCRDAAELESFCRRHSAAVTSSRARVEKVVAVATKLGVDAASVDAWLGVDAAKRIANGENPKA